MTADGRYGILKAQFDLCSNALSRFGKYWVYCLGQIALRGFVSDAVYGELEKTEAQFNEASMTIRVKLREILAEMNNKRRVKQ